MSNVSTSRKSHNVSRTLRLVAPLDLENRNGLLQITIRSGVKKIKEEVFEYRLAKIAADFGAGFLLEKQNPPAGPGEPTAYHVNVNGQHSTCECQGFTRWGMGKDGTGCKHIAALAKLIELGKV
jgi:hypothetical protein